MERCPIRHFGCVSLLLKTLPKGWTLKHKREKESTFACVHLRIRAYIFLSLLSLFIKNNFCNNLFFKMKFTRMISSS